MLAVKNIHITQFKNYEISSFDFEKNVIGICGLNGRGKTNLLDAIYYCCFTRSYFSATDQLNIRFNSDGFRLEASFFKNEEPQKIICINRGNLKKELSLNDIPYQKLSKHIGLFTAVMIAPDDVEITYGSPELRRRYLDTLLSQADPHYLSHLIVYNKVMQQRNSLLRQMSSSSIDSIEILNILDAKLVEAGIVLHKKRSDLVNLLQPIVNRFYSMIVKAVETINLSYCSQLETADFGKLLQQHRQKDMLLQRTGCGIHKDDLLFSLNGYPFKQIASQGQRKSLLFALKLAEFEYLKSIKGFAPILLLDDVFEKLDDERMSELLKWVCTQEAVQVFITDTHEERLQNSIQLLDVDFQLIRL